MNYDCENCYCWLEESAGEETRPESEKGPPGRKWPSDGAEDYVRDRRLLELMQFLMAKLLAHMPEHPTAFLIQLLDDLMMFRSKITPPPYLYEDRHLKELLKSFDPGERMWISPDQLMQARLTVGLEAHKVPCCHAEEKIPVDKAHKLLRTELDAQLYKLVTAGMETTSTSNGRTDEQ